MYYVVIGGIKSSFYATESHMRNLRPCVLAEPTNNWNLCLAIISVEILRYKQPHVMACF